MPKSVTLSVGQLCQKLKKINYRFKYEFVNETETVNSDEDEQCITNAEILSPAKVQRIFCEDIISDIFEYAN